MSKATARRRPSICSRSCAQDRTFEDDGARRELLQFFEVWGFKDPATVSARRKLSSMLFS